MADGPKDAQEAALALEMYQRQLDALSRQIEFLQGVSDDINRARSTLEGLAEGASNEILMPVGASTFVRGRVEDSEHVLLGIGSGYVTERTRAEALAKLEVRGKSVEQELERLMQAAVQVQQEAARLQEAYEDEGPQA